MDLNQILRNHTSEPLTHQLLMSLLKDQMTKCKLPIQHILEPIKKGLYIAGPSLETVFPEPFFSGKSHSRPSYISSDSALSDHGLIPERVYEISSITIKVSRKFTTSLGVFTYRYLPLP